MTDTTDRELLELAAKAAGIVHSHYRATDEGIFHDGGKWWNPLTDDGDALRLDVKLNLRLLFNPELNQALVKPYHIAGFDGETREDGEKHPDPYAATRRAIVRAAAEIAKAMPPAIRQGGDT